MDKDNSGILFLNKKTNDTQPDYTGDATIEGKKYKVSAWINTARSGNKYIALRYKEDGSHSGSETKPSQSQPLDHRTYDPDDDFSL